MHTPPYFFIFYCFLNNAFFKKLQLRENVRVTQQNMQRNTTGIKRARYTGPRSPVRQVVEPTRNPAQRPLGIETKLGTQQGNNISNLSNKAADPPEKHPQKEAVNQSKK